MTAPPSTGAAMRLLQNVGRGDEPVQFLAFLVWYIFLVLCCLIPTCCAYRRRRIMERRLAEQQATMQQRLQQSNLLFLSNFANDSTGPSLERVRTQLITDDLTSTTMRLESHHFVPSAAAAAAAAAAAGVVAGVAAGVAAGTTATNQQAVSSLSETPVVVSGDGVDVNDKKDDVEAQMEDFDTEEHTGFIQIPNHRPAAESVINSSEQHQQREETMLVSDTCTICLCQYVEGESITWSTRPECVHAFHTQCIISWLAKQDQGPQCPVCRQEFCSRSFLPAVRQEDEFLRTIQQALFLTQFYGGRNNGRNGNLGDIQLITHGRPLVMREEPTSTSAENENGLTSRRNNEGDV